MVQKIELCKDCIHSKVSWIDAIRSFGFPKWFHYKCSKSWVSPAHDIITGHIIPGHFKSCTGARYSNDDCGEKAIFWQSNKLRK